jgi:hypothetical protein
MKEKNKTSFPPLSLSFSVASSAIFLQLQSATNWEKVLLKIK